MDFKAARKAEATPRPDVWICFRPERAPAKAGDLARLHVPDDALRSAATRSAKSGEFLGKAGEVVLLHGGADGRRLMLIGLGKPADVTRESLRVAAGLAARALEARRIAHAMLLVPGGDNLPRRAEALVEGAGLAAYRFDRLKSEREKPHLRRLTFAPEGKGPALGATVKRAAAMVAAVSYARDLGNLPGNVATPVHLAREAQKLAGGPLSVRIHDRAAIRRMKMGAFSAVAQASRNEPRLIEFRYRSPGTPKGARKRRIALVGKGVTFDTGGISIKPSAGMEEMKFDMCGGAAVFGAMHLLKALKPKLDVHALVPATDNMPDGAAYRPGDILTARNGKTIEVLSTDAEGRLLLCDALAYAAEKKPDCIVDLATLTGACVVALADAACGLFGSDAALIEEVRTAGESSGETAWPMPLLPRYTEMIRGDYADLKNAGGRWGGACTAAAFLAQFVGDRPWVHLDIAGTAWTDRDQGYRRKGATGFGVRLLAEFLRARERS